MLRIWSQKNSSKSFYYLSSSRRSLLVRALDKSRHKIQLDMNNSSDCMKKLRNQPNTLETHGGRRELSVQSAFMTIFHFSRFKFIPITLLSSPWTQSSRIIFYIRIAGYSYHLQQTSETVKSSAYFMCPKSYRERGHIITSVRKEKQETKFFIGY